MALAPRQRAQAIAGRRGGRHTLAVPLAPRLAAKIAERPWETFLTDPTQLTNGLNDLLEALRPDGVAVTLPSILAEDSDGARRDAALEATRRLRATVGDGAVLLAVQDDTARTVGNVTRFHRAMAHVLGAGASGLPGAELVPLDEPVAKTGLVLTDSEVPDDVGIPVVQDWLTGVRG